MTWAAGVQPVPLGLLKPTLYPKTSLQIQIQLLVMGGEEGFFSEPRGEGAWTWGLGTGQAGNGLCPEYGVLCCR